MNKFDNTYIDVSGKSPSAIYELAKKYSGASGIEINSDDLEEGGFEEEWDYLCCRLGGDYSYTGVYVTGEGENLPENPKQITEEDLYSYLKQQEKTVKTSQELPEEFIITGADNLAVRQWLKDKGYTWVNGRDLTDSLLGKDVLSYKAKDEGLTQSTLETYKKIYPHLPIITPNIVVTGFDISYPTPDKSAKEVKIENIEKQLAEIQETLKKLKGGE